MPLRVHCPEGCLIRVPSNRAGKMVRCPRCKSIILLPTPSKSELSSGKPIPMKATLVKNPEKTQLPETKPIVEEPAPRESIRLAAETVSDEARTPLNQPSSSAPDSPLRSNQSKKSSSEPRTKSKNQKRSKLKTPAPRQTKTEPEPQSPASGQKVSKSPPKNSTPKPTQPSSTAANPDSNNKVSKTAFSETTAIRKDATNDVVPNGRRTNKPAVEKTSTSKNKSHGNQTNGKPQSDKTQTVEESKPANADVLVSTAAKTAPKPIEKSEKSSVAKSVENRRTNDGRSNGKKLDRKLEVFRPIKPVNDPALDRFPSRSETISESSASQTTPRNEFHITRDPNKKSDEVFVRRVKNATSDRIVLARFYAVCLCLVGIFNLVPAIYCWYQWGSSDIDVTITGSALPRWTYLQIFVSALHFVYAIYLYQLPDWSALRTVAIAMLAFASVFGVVSTGLLVGGGQGSVAQFLNLPNVYVRNACIWCVAMLCLATLISYLTGRESTIWKRTELLLNQILSGQS